MLTDIILEEEFEKNGQNWFDQQDLEHELTYIMDNPSHPLHDTVGSLSCSFSSRLRHPPCKKERCCHRYIW